MKKNTRDYSDTECPMDGLLRILMGPWTTYILWQLHSNGEMRFGQLKKQMPGISSKMLTERLRMLEEAGIIHREQEMTIPPKVTYSQTERGRDLNKILDDLHKLAKKWHCPGTEKFTEEKPQKKRA